MKMIRQLVVLVAGLWVGGLSLPAATYQIGNVVTEVTNLVDRATGQPVPLSQLEGKILFIDFFAHWCPVCRGAAPQILTEIDDYYETRHGNPDGVPILHIGANLQADSTPANRNATTTFIQTYRVPLTIQDTSRRFQGRFGPTSGQPTFVIINGLTNSTSHRPWELIYARFSYQDSLQTRPITQFRSAIDSVKAGPGRLRSFGIEPDGTWTFDLEGGPRVRRRMEWSTDLDDWRSSDAIIPADATFPYRLPAPSAASSAFIRILRAD